MECQITLKVNGNTVDAMIDTRSLLVDFLRDELGLTGTHVGCTTGNCGACTVDLDGFTVKSCTLLAADVSGSHVVTIEGINSADGVGGDLSSIQQAFVKHHALQCGFCTPGMVLSVRQLLKKNPHPSQHDIRRGIAGNLCRCTGYASIVRAVLDLTHE